MSEDNTLSMNNLEGIYLPPSTLENPDRANMPILARVFDEISLAHEKAAIGMGQALEEMDKAKDMMEVASAQVELSVIQEAGGDEKKVGSTEAARQREYTIARGKSTHYLTARDHYFSARNDYRYHQAMLRRFDLRMQFIITTAR